MSNDARLSHRRCCRSGPCCRRAVSGLSRQSYTALGFQPMQLADRMIKMRLAACSSILQDYYVREWADNFVMHLRVSDARLWWDRIVTLDLQSRFKVEARPPHTEAWGLVADLLEIVRPRSVAELSRLLSPEPLAAMGVA